MSGLQVQVNNIRYMCVCPILYAWATKESLSAVQDLTKDILILFLYTNKLSYLSKLS